jgi:hypothetical protein
MMGMQRALAQAPERGTTGVCASACVHLLRLCAGGLFGCSSQPLQQVAVDSKEELEELQALEAFSRAKERSSKSDCMTEAQFMEAMLADAGGAMTILRYVPGDWSGLRVAVCNGMLALRVLVGCIYAGVVGLPT